jgi:heme oxygenase
MVCANAKWCDFISYDPRVKEDYRMFIFRLELTEEEKAAVTERVLVAFEHMKGLVKEIEAAKPKLLLG